MARKKYIAGNWKMHKTAWEAKSLAGALVGELVQADCKLMVAPPFTALPGVAEALKDSNILLGAQNMASEEEGAHTGEVSVLMLKDLGVSEVILGHSERRHIYGETDELINKKIHLALKHDISVVFCIGETLEERERGDAEKIVIDQINKGLNQIGPNDFKNITIAYEPVWAIGTGKTATPEDADAIHKVVRRKINDIYGNKTAEDCIIQYGGSVKPNNAKELMAMENIDGALVGGASLKAETFVPIALYNK